MIEIKSYSEHIKEKYENKEMYKKGDKVVFSIKAKEMMGEVMKYMKEKDMYEVECEGKMYEVPMKSMKMMKMNEADNKMMKDGTKVIFSIDNKPMMGTVMKYMKEKDIYQVQDMNKKMHEMKYENMMKQDMNEAEDKMKDPKYKMYFDKMLAKYKVKTVGELDDEMTKKFFKEVDDGYKAMNEEMSQTGIRFGNMIRMKMLECEGQFVYLRDMDGEKVGVEYIEDFRMMCKEFAGKVEDLVSELTMEED